MDLSTYVDKTFGTVDRTLGRHGYHFYNPRPLPRSLDLNAATTLRLSAADRALGRLAGTGRLLPNAHLLVQPYITAEALASSRIEGTQASLSDVLEAEADEQDSPDLDIREVQNYIAAFEQGLNSLDSLPLSLRLVRGVHARLLRDVRGEEKNPGEFRLAQNWIGPPGCTLEEAVFVPPRHDPEMLAALHDWESFLHDEDHDLPPLVACSLVHYQFETIHPFLDGNGRLGRLVIVLYLMMLGELPQPLLYLSPYFERRRSQYYDLLQGVRERGEVQRWLQFFLEGVATQANDAVERAEHLVNLQGTWRALLAEDRSRAWEVVELLFDNPFVTTRRVQSSLGITNAGANNLLRRLENLGVLRQSSVTGRGGRITRYAPAILDVLHSAADSSPDAPDSDRSSGDEEHHQGQDGEQGLADGGAEA